MTKDGLNRHAVDIGHRQFCVQALVNRLQALRYRIFGGRSNHPRRQQLEAPTRFLDDGVACGSGAGVDSENAHVFRLLREGGEQVSSIGERSALVQSVEFIGALDRILIVRFAQCTVRFQTKPVRSCKRVENSCFDP